jgi:cyclic pyranopterin phosphate synthase
MKEFTHFNIEGRAKMVNVGHKDVTWRKAVACGRVYMKQETLELIEKGQMKKGDVLAVAQVGGIMGAKQTWSLIPMCHPLNISGVDMRFSLNKDVGAVEIEAEVSVEGKTGVEMEALTAVSIGALTVYDMCKAVDKEMVIGDIMLMQKTGGKSGDFVREG